MTPEQSNKYKPEWHWNGRSLDKNLGADNFEHCPMCGKPIKDECEKGYPGGLCPKCWGMAVDADMDSEEDVA